MTKSPFNFDNRIRVAPGFGGKEALLFKSRPTTIKQVHEALTAFEALRQKHPESEAEISNLEGAFQRLANQLSNAATMIATAVGQHQVNEAIKKAQNDARDPDTD